MSIFDRFTELDPALALRRIEAAHGSAMFDRFAYLDPQHAIHQIESALSIDLDDVYGVFGSNVLEDEIDAALEEGGSPEWVPANAKIYIDLVNDRAWTEADGEVAINTLLGSDPNAQTDWGDTEYNPADLTADGLVVSNVEPALIGVARTKVLATCTARFAFKGDDSGAVVYLLTTNGAISLVFTIGLGDNKLHLQTTNGVQPETDPVRNSGVGALNVMAFTLDDGRVDMACNGSAVVSEVIGETERPSGNPLSAVVIKPTPAPTALQSITIYDALPSTAGLSELSETGA